MKEKDFEKNDPFKNLLEGTGGLFSASDRSSLMNTNLLLTMISKSIDITIMTAFISVYISVQSIFAIFWFADVIDWAWYWAFAPTIIIPAIYIIRSYIKRKSEEKKSRELQVKAQDMVNQIESGDFGLKNFFDGLKEN